MEVYAHVREIEQPVVFHVSLHVTESDYVSLPANQARFLKALADAGYSIEQRHAAWWLINRVTTGIDNYLNGTDEV